MRVWYDKKPGYAAAKVRARRLREGDVLREYDKLREQTQKLRRRASRLVNNRTRRGTLEKGPCEWCGTTKNVQCHHRDYNKPFDVMWLCREHHGEWHRHYTPVYPGETRVAPPRERPQEIR